jgi:hypothetical protein
VAIYTNQPKKRKNPEENPPLKDIRKESTLKEKSRIYEISEMKCVTNVWYGSDKRNMGKHAEEAM